MADGGCRCSRCVPDENHSLREDELPYHLRKDSPPLGQCLFCGRKTWDDATVGTRCGLTQPDGRECVGHIQRIIPLTPTRGGNRMSDETILMRSPAGTYERVNPGDEFRYLAWGWSYHPSRDLSGERHGMRNP